MDSYNNNETSGEQKIEFENQWERPNEYYGQRKTTKIIELTIRYSGGIIKDERQASYILLIISALIIVVSLFILFRGGSVPNVPPPANYPPFQNR